MRKDDLAKLDAEPDLVAISGRPAYMLVGGEIGYQVTNALSGTVVGFKEYGTRLDFVPIVLGNGRMHIDWCPRQRPGRRQQQRRHSRPHHPRHRDRRGTAGRANAGHRRPDPADHRGQQPRPAVDQRNPLSGPDFRSVSYRNNEIELLVLITPEIVDGMEPGQVPACLPGMQTTDPGDWDLFFKGHLEVPACCPDEPAVCQNCPAAAAGFAIRAIPRSAGRIRRPSRGEPMAMIPQSAEPGFIGPIGYDVLK